STSIASVPRRRLVAIGLAGNDPQCATLCRMAITKCEVCGQRMSSQWPECPSCGAVRGKPGTSRRRRFSPQPHYLISSALATIGALIYGGQILNHSLNRGLLTAGMAMIAVGACWYAAARLLALMSRQK
ncbi:MAG: hypothetical protein AAFR09_10615, partial [Pseudomonadota bacterium]